MTVRNRQDTTLHELYSVIPGKYRDIIQATNGLEGHYTSWGDAVKRAGIANKLEKQGFSEIQATMLSALFLYISAAREVLIDRG